VHGNRVVELVIDCVGLVIPDRQSIPVRRELSDEKRSQPPFSPCGNTDIPGSRMSSQYGCEAVNTEQGSRPPTTTIEHAGNRVVVGAEEVVCSGAPFILRKIEIPSDGEAVAFFSDRLRTSKGSIAVDDQTRVATQYERRIELGREAPCNGGSAGIPADVLP